MPRVSYDPELIRGLQGKRLEEYQEKRATLFWPRARPTYLRPVASTPAIASAKVARKADLLEEYGPRIPPIKKHPNMCKQWCRDEMSEVFGPQLSHRFSLLTISKIQEVVAEKFDISKEVMLSSSRLAGVVIPRQVAMYMCRVVLSRSFLEIGSRFINEMGKHRDHTSVIHAYRATAWRIGDLSVDPPVNALDVERGSCKELAEDVASLRQLLEG